MANRFTVVGLGEGIATNVGLNYNRIVLLSTGLIAVATGVVTVVVCDIVGRTIIAPFEVPVSLILGVVGAVVFVGLLLRQRRHG